MKNTYIIAIKNHDTFEPIFIKTKPHQDITRLGKHYRRAYICESKKEAESLRKEQYNQYKKNFLSYNDKNNE